MTSNSTTAVLTDWNFTTKPWSALVTFACGSSGRGEGNNGEEIIRSAVSKLQETLDTGPTDAFTIGQKAHEGQTRKDGKTPYFTHSIRVGQTLESPTLTSAGYLHDVVEDTEVTLDDLREQGMSEEVVDLVDSMTRRKDQGETYARYICRLCDRRAAILLKMSDIADNIGELPESDFSMLKRYSAALRVMAHALEGYDNDL